MPNQSSIQRVAGDIFDLCELQMELLSVDSQAAKRKLSRAIVCTVVAATLAGSALTVVLIGLGFLLHEFATLSSGVGLLIVGGVTFGIVVVLLLIALLAAKAAAAAMNETKSEFAENLRWLKATLISPTSSPRNQLRSETFAKTAEPPRDSRLNPQFATPLSRM